MSYKLSNYNFFVEYKGRVILHNLLTGSLFSFERDLFDKINISLNKINSSDKINPHIFDLLVNTGFIIDSEFDEIDYIRLSYIKEMAINPFYRLTINPSLECNFSCWYCYQNHPKGHMSQEVQNKIKLLCDNLINGNQVSGINLGWFGGEPLMYFNEVVYPLSYQIKKIVDDKNLRFYNSITTNGFLATQDLISKFREIELSEFQITLDGDEKRHNKIRNHNGKPSFSRIAENINLIVNSNNDAKICLRINYDKKTFNGLNSIFKYFANIKNNIYIDLQRVWQTYEEEGMPIGNSAIEFSNQCIENGFKLMNSYITTGKGTPCYADRMNFAHINFDGKVYKCTARNYEEKNELGIIDDKGFIKWHTGKLMPPHRKFSFDNEQCLKCKYLPICLGPCFQKRFEKTLEAGYCFAQGYNEFIKDYIILKYRQKFNDQQNQTR
ncbi:MAG: radical SAM protein [Bacteroidales bacterium]|nr:radical SAM protein [Bacteroidales bacterium]MBN2748211.1 radical SAM protein [Bacteroidales bacterium]